MIGLTNAAGGKGKAKPKKMLAIETRPSPAGRRVVPTTDALRNKFEAIKNANKKKKTKVSRRVLLIICFYFLF